MAAGELVVSIIGDMRELSKTFSQAQTEIGKIGKEFEEMGKKLTNTGKTMSTYVTAPLVGIGAISLHTAANFDDAMRKVQAISGATGSDFEKLTNQARELGAATAFSATDAAEAMYYLALAGWDVNEIMEATPGLLSLASAAGMDLGKAADIVSDTMSGFQMDATQAGEAANIFAAASSSSNTDVLQLGEALKYAGATANAAGMDLVQTTAILGVLADSGVKGSMAGTALNAMLRDMKKAAVDGAIGIGTHTIALYNEDGTMRDLGAVMADVGMATADMTVEQRDAALAAIFHEESIRGVNIMLATGSERYYELEGKIRDSDGAAKRMAETMEGGVGGALREMESAMEELMIVLGNILVIGVLPLIKYLTDLFNEISKLPEPVQKAAVAIGAILAVIGPLLIAMGFVVSSIGTLAKAFGAGGIFAKALIFAKGAIASITASIGTLVPPILLVIAAVAALALAWKNNWFDIQGKAKIVWDWLESNLKKLVNRMEFYYHALEMAISMLHLEKRWKEFVNRMEYYYHALVMGASMLYSDLKLYWGSLSAALEPAKKNLSSMWESILKIWDVFKSTFVNSVSKLYNEVKIALDPLWSVLEKLWTQIKTVVAPAIEKLLTILGGKAIDSAQGKVSLFVTAINLFSGALSKLLEWVSKHPEITKFVSVIAAMAIAVPAALALVVAGVIYFVATVASKFIEAIKYAYDLYIGWKDHLNNLKVYISGLPGAITGYLQTLLSNWATHWTNFKNVIGNASTLVIGVLVTFVNGLESSYNSMIASLTNFKTQMLTRWAEIRTGVYTKLTELINDAQTWLNNQQTKFNTAISQITDLKTRAIARWTELKSGILNKLNEIISDIQNWINRQNDKFSQAVASVNDLKTRVIKAFSDMLSEIRTKINEIINAIKELPAKVKALGTEAYNAGKALVQKLIDGLKSKLQEVKNTVSEITKLSSITESSAAKSVKSAGSGVVNTIKSTGTKAKVSLAEAAQGLRRLLPSSPAKEGPFKKLPNWDAVFVDPLEESIKTAKGFTAPLKSTLSSLRSPLDSMAGGLKHVSNVSTSSTNYEGSTYSIGPNYVRNDSDLQAIISAVKSSIANDRRRKGIFS